MQLRELTPGQVKSGLKKQQMKIPYAGQNKVDTGDSLIWANYKKWDVFLRKNGWKKLGNGSFSAVYGKAGLTYVLKVPFVRDGPWMNYANYCKKNKSNPHVMKISFIKEESSNHFFIAAIERLQPFPRIGGRSMAEYAAEVLQQLADRPLATVKKKLEIRIKNLHSPTWGNQMPAGPKKQADWLQTILLPQLDKLAKVVEYLGKNGQLDLHDGNIMMRGNTVVIIDPWFDWGEARKTSNVYS